MDQLSYINSLSPEYLDELKTQYIENPNSVPLSWRLFFDGATLAENSVTNNSTTNDGKSDLESKVTSLIDAYRSRGHLKATLDPLGRGHTSESHRLDLSIFALNNIDKNQKFQSAQLLGLPASTLDKIVKHLETTYCQDIGVEFTHISDERAHHWLEKKMEPTSNTPRFTNEQKEQFFTDLAEATLFEDFLQKSFTGQKRFSLEGGEALIPALKQIIRLLAKQGSKEAVIGMAHRGRLNTLVNAMKKPYSDVFREFFGTTFSDDFEGSGDVKYHMGYSNEVDVNGNNFHVSLAFNPSHLEAIDPVVEGMAKAKQNDKYDCDTNSIVPILIHGDAAVIGQGVVTETLNFSDIEGYQTGGSLHIVINNQVGFTANPDEARSTIYCTDFAKSIQAPIFHVNGDNIEAVVHAITMATEFRQEFHRDVFVDIYCYRKYGHNEGDEPKFTQPGMYDIISKKQNPFKIYETKLLDNGSITVEKNSTITDNIKKTLEKSLTIAKEQQKDFNIDALNKNWRGLRQASSEDMLNEFSSPTKLNVLNKIIEEIHTIPKEMKLLGKFERMISKRLDKLNSAKPSDLVLDWAVAEQLAFGTLLTENYSVRLSGQDSKRGTFSHRHIEFNDIATGNKYMPLKKFESKDSKLTVLNSPLSEYGVLGFDFGYASSSPKTLTIWEAQFGDFANGAQIMIDQFISSSESKWRRMNGIVMLLPHGYEGQGPEHSSAKLERFLQLAGQANMQITYPTTPAQFFHLLRRQVLRDFRKPLVVMSPKSPLRMPEVISSKDDLTKGSFQNFITTGASAKSSKRVIFCSGKVYWDLLKKTKEEKLEDEITFVRLEQLYPLDLKQIGKIQKEYNKVKNWIWCQEEPKNMGAWGFFRLQTLDMNLPLIYAGRETSASPATGSPKVHLAELNELLKVALDI